MLEALADKEIDGAVVSRAAARYFNLSHPGQGLRMVDIDGLEPAFSGTVEEYRTYWCDMTVMDSVTGHWRRPERIQECPARSQAVSFRGRTCCAGCRAVSEALPQKALEPMK